MKSSSNAYNCLESRKEFKDKSRITTQSERTKEREYGSSKYSVYSIGATNRKSEKGSCK